MKKFLALIILYFICIYVYGNTIDSLQRVLKNADDKTKLAIYEELCICYYSINLDTASDFALKKLDLAKKTKNIKEQAVANKLLGNVNYFMGEYDVAIRYYSEALNLANLVKDNDIKASALNNMGNIYRNRGEYDKALEHFINVLKIDSAENNPGGIGSSLTNLGNVYLDKSEYSKAIEYYKKALKIAEELNDKPRIISALNNMGLAYHWISDFEKTSMYYFSALKKSEEIEDLSSMIHIFLNLGSLYQEWQQQDKALELFNKARQMSTKINDIPGLVKALENIGIIYNEKGQTDSALVLFKQAYEKAKVLDEPKISSSILENTGYAYELKKDYKKAKTYYEEAFNIRQKNEDADDMASSLNSLGRISFLLKEYELALKYIERSNQLAVYAATKIDNYKLLSDIYNSLNNLPRSFEYYKKYAQMRDSIFTGEKHKQIQELRTQYETEKKEQEIATLSAEKQIEILKNQQSKNYIITLIGIMVVLFAGALFLFRFNKLRAQHNATELEQKLLRSQMNPHFIFNAISCIQEFIMDKNPLEASSYLSNFAKLMRSILNNSSKEFISLDEELATLENYLKLQKLRFPNKFEYQIKIDDNLEPEEILLPPMLSQPFIENAINHGIAKSNRNDGLIVVDFYKEKNNLFIKIDDNGGGIQNKNDENIAKHQSMATKITKSRIKNFKKEYKEDVFFELKNIVIPNMETMGVQVSFKLPLQYKST